MKRFHLPFFLIFSLILVGCSPPRPGSIDSSSRVGVTSPTRQTTRTPVETDSSAAPSIKKGNNPAGSIQSSQANLTIQETIQPKRSATTAAAEKTSPTSTSTARAHSTDNPAPIQIFGPGPGSKVTSPVQVQSLLTSQDGKLLRVELRGEDGRLLSRLVKLPNVYPWTSAQLSIPLFFEISSPKENGRLTISVDDQYGRTIDLNSIDLVLLDFGEADLQASSEVESALFIQQPTDGGRISGGSVAVEGIYRRDLPSPVKVKLISQDGKTLGHRMAADSLDTAAGTNQFKTIVPYSVSKRTPARLVVYIDSVNGGQTLHLSSVEVTLYP